LIANGIEGRESRVTDGRGLLERQVGRLRQEVVLWSARILGESALAPAEHLIARSKLLHVSADRLDPARDISSRDLALRLAQADHHAHDVRHAPQEVPVADIDRRGVNAYQHLAVADHRLVDVLALQDIRRAVPVLDDRPSRSAFSQPLGQLLSAASPRRQVPVTHGGETPMGRPRAARRLLVSRESSSSDGSTSELPPRGHRW